MRALLKLSTLAGAERRLLAEAAPLVLLVRLLLWALPSPVILRWVRRIGVGGRDASAPSIPIDTVIWAVEAVSRRVPRASCLTQAVSAQLLLQRHGYASTLCVGVARGTQGLSAHAWLERNDCILIGGAGSRSLVRLPDLARAARAGAQGNRP